MITSKSSKPALLSQKLKGSFLLLKLLMGIATVIAEAEKCKEEGVSRTILMNLCGHGNFDMKAYEDYFDGKIVKHEITSEEIAALPCRIGYTRD